MQQLIFIDLPIVVNSGSDTPIESFGHYVTHCQILQSRQNEISIMLWRRGHTGAFFAALTLLGQTVPFVSFLLSFFLSLTNFCGRIENTSSHFLVGSE